MLLKELYDRFKLTPSSTNAKVTDSYIQVSEETRSYCFQDFKTSVEANEYCEMIKSLPSMAETKIFRSGQFILTYKDRQK